jgi:hypothetical protein
MSINMHGIGEGKHLLTLTRLTSFALAGLVAVSGNSLSWTLPWCSGWDRHFTYSPRPRPRPGKLHRAPLEYAYSPLPKGKLLLPPLKPPRKWSEPSRICVYTISII